MEQDRPEVVVVTGASAGVGRAVVREFARRSAAVGLIARGKDRLEAAWREVELGQPPAAADHAGGCGNCGDRRACLEAKRGLRLG